MYNLNSDTTIQFVGLFFTPNSTKYSKAFGKFYSLSNAEDTVLMVKLESNEFNLDRSNIACSYPKSHSKYIIASILSTMAFTIFYAVNGLAFFEALRQKDHGRVRMYHTLNYATVIAIFVTFSFI